MPEWAKTICQQFRTSSGRRQGLKRLKEEDGETALYRSRFGSKLPRDRHGSRSRPQPNGQRISGARSGSLGNYRDSREAPR